MDEFTNYIIEKATVLKHLKSKTEQIKAYTKSLVKPKQKIDDVIAKTVYISNINRLALFTQGSNTIKFMNPDTGQFNQKNLIINAKQFTVNISSLKKDRKQNKIQMKNKQLIVETQTRVLDMLYISQSKYEILITSTSDCVVKGWKYTPNGFVPAFQPDNQQQILQHQFNQQIFCLAWDELNQLLYCGQKDGSIIVWNLKTDTQLSLPSGQKQQRGHHMLIMDMIVMPKLQFMASGGMDGKLVLWDTINNKIKCVYKQHTRGILTLAFNQSLILLFSAGFDHKICIWNPYIPSLIHKIEGHVAPILSVKVIQGTHQVISLDSDGIVKISDTRRFNFISSFSLQSNQQTKISPTTMTIIPKPLKICFSGKSISIFEYDKNYNPNSVDDSFAICCKYVQDSLIFLTPAGNKVKVWNALTGDIDKIYLQVTHFQISAFCLDHFQRRMLIGDIKGNVCIYNSKNGAKIKTLPNHLGQIIYLTAHNLDNTDIFISASVDNQIHVSKQTDQSYEHIKTIQIKKQYIISSIAFCSNTRLIIVGLNNGNIGFYQIQTGKQIANLNQMHTQQITCLCIVQTMVLISATISGKIILNYMPPNLQKYQKIFGQSHKDPQCPSNNLGILLGTYNKKLKYFYVIDQKCYMTCYGFCQKKNQKNPQGLKKSLYRQQFNFHAFYIVWSIKTHNQLVRSLEFIQSQQIIITSSYDKKVVIWNASKGEIIDSLQQNYDKREPKPIAFKKKSTGEFFAPNLVDVINTKIPQKRYQSKMIQFDPFKQLQTIDMKRLTVVKSNQEWKLQIKYKDHYEKQIREFEQIIDQCQKFIPSNSKLINQINFQKTQIEQQKIRIKTLLKTVRQGSDFKTTREQDLIQKSNENNNLKKFFSKKQRKILQTFNLKKMKSQQILKKENEQHSHYINTLSKRHLRSAMLAQQQNKIYLSKKEADAANKLGQALYEIDKDQKRLINFTNNIVIRSRKVLKFK